MFDSGMTEDYASSACYARRIKNGANEKVQRRKGIGLDMAVPFLFSRRFPVLHGRLCVGIEGKVSRRVPAAAEQISQAPGVSDAILFFHGFPVSFLHFPGIFCGEKGQFIPWKPRNAPSMGPALPEGGGENMRKAMTVILWLGLTVCVATVISLSGQKYALKQECADEAQKNEVLQAMFDQAKDEWAEKEAALTDENSALLRDTRTLTLERDALMEALKAAEQETQTQRQAADALTAERETASGRLSEVLAMLMTPVPALPADGDETENDPFAKALPLPVRGIQAVPFAE